MRLFKLFWGWTENTSSSPAHWFFSPLLCSKIFPSYLLPRSTSLTSFPAHSISKAWESSRAWVAQSFEETWNTRLEEGGKLNVEGMWKGESKRSASSQMQKWKKKGKFPPFSGFFFFSMVFFFFLLLQKKKMLGESVETKTQGQSGSLKESSFPFSTFLFFSTVFLFFFLMFEKKKIIGKNIWNKRVEVGGQK